MLVSEATVLAMAQAYQQADSLDLENRLMLALEAGDAAGGDKRGKQSAALYIVGRDTYPHWDLRVNHRSQPIATLHVLLEESRKDYYQSFRQYLPVFRRQILSMPSAWLDETVEAPCRSKFYFLSYEARAIAIAIPQTIPDNAKSDESSGAARNADEALKRSPLL